ncbi:MAG: NAD-dependent epimerase/dehydratase family protein [Anaerolineales bacterium]|nr:NAD-dependent epimerase/dehydratase family protein [Anaerolineales bacterium]
MNNETKIAGLNILVTGGAGFIGSHLVEALLERKAKVTVISRLPLGMLVNLENCMSMINYIKLDILSPDVKELVATNKYDIIYHLANNAHVPSSIGNPISDMENNLLSTLNLLETIRLKSPSTKIVYLSSAAVYGNPGYAPIDEFAPLAPISPYGVSKLAAERYISIYSVLYGLQTVTLRPFSVYGPRQTKQVIYDLMKKLSQNPIELNLDGDGTQIRDFCYVDDVVRAILLVTLNGKLIGEAYNLASSQGHSISHLAHLVSDIMGVTPRIVFSGINRPGDPQEWIADISQLTSLGYSPQVELSEGIFNTYQWYQHNLSSTGV